MKSSYLFLGFAIPDDEIKKDFENDINPSVQTHKFNWNFIKALEASDEVNITYISTRPVSDFPHNKKKIYLSNKWEYKLSEKKTLEINEIGFLNTSILKIITRFISGLFQSLTKFNKAENRKGVIVYSVHLPFMIIGFITSRIFRTDLIGIWTDPPSVPNKQDSYLKNKLRNIESKISKYFMKKFTKIITLTDYLVNDFSPGTPYLVVEGIINNKEIYLEKKYKKNNPLKIVYTGIISKKYGLDNLVNAFRKINKKNVELDIYGWGDYQEELEKISKEELRINYKGFLPNNKILEVQRSADFLINTRSSTDDYVKYSFPSKTLEYMMSGTPVISTMLPGIPLQYEDHLITIENNDEESIIGIINEISEWNKEEIQKIGQKSRDFSATKSYEIQGRKIIEFLKNKI